MMKILSDKRKCNKKYKIPKSNTYEHVFFRDLTSGYKYIFGEDKDGKNFYSIEPEDSKLKKLLSNSDGFLFNFDMGKLVGDIAYSLIAYGEGFIYIKPEYLENNGEHDLYSIKIGEILGFVKKNKKHDIIFCHGYTDEEVELIEMKKNQLIVFKLEEIGFDRKYFRNIYKNLARIDMYKSSLNMMTNQKIGYDLLLHSRKTKFSELKITNEIGWVRSVDDISDSYLLYRTIKQKKLKLQLLNYIVDKLNEGLSAFIGESCGKIVTNVKYRDYDGLWEEYSLGKISTSQLRNQLFN